MISISNLLSVCDQTNQFFLWNDLALADRGETPSRFLGATLAISGWGILAKKTDQDFENNVDNAELVISWVTLPEQLSAIFPEKQEGMEYGVALAKNILSIVSIFAATLLFICQKTVTTLPGRVISLFTGVELLFLGAALLHTLISCKKLPNIWEKKGMPYTLFKLAIKTSTMALFLLSGVALVVSAPTTLILSILIMTALLAAARNADLLYNKALE